MYGHDLTDKCTEPGCTSFALITDDDDPKVLRCVPHAFAVLRDVPAATPTRC